VPIAISDAHRELEGVARSFLAKADARAHARALLDAPDETLPPFWTELAQLGWLGLHLPESVGGSGYGLPELAVVVQELGRAVAPGPFLPTVMASAVVALAGDEAQQADLLPALADGSRTAALGLGGTLSRDPGGALAGDAGVVLGAGLVDVLVLVAGDDMIVVPAGADGVTRTVKTGLDPTRRSASIRLDGVTPTHVLAGAADTARAVARALVAAECAGGAQECVDRATEYAKDRLQFGRVIGMFQAVKHHCANMLVASELATAGAWDAARALEAGGVTDQFRLAAAVAAVDAVPAYFANAKLNIQVHGGIGFTWDHDAHMLLRRASVLASLFDHAGAAEDITALRAAGVTREFGLDLPPEAEPLRVKAAAMATELAGLSGTEQRARLVDSGYSHPHWPKPWGLAAPALEQLVIDEEFKKAGVSRPNLGITAWNILSVIQYGTDDQIERWVRPTLLGELVWCQLFSEPDAGSDAAGIRTKATRVDGGFLINGQKVWTSGAQYCHKGLATVRTNPDAPKHQGITTVVIDMKAKGVDVRPLREATGSAIFNEVFFNDVFVPDDDVVGPVDAGWTVARATLGNERVSIGGGTGVPIATDPLAIYQAADAPFAGAAIAVGEYLAEAQTLRLLNLRSAERAVAGGEPGPEGNVTKLVSAENMQRSADLALRLAPEALVQVEGVGLAISQTLIFSRAMTIAGGTSEITRNQIGERILGLPRDPLIK
jgi:alkylation response protein AidB-like acyl-CoA dehydrogenase